MFAGVAEPAEGERDGAAGVGGGGDVRLLRPRPRQGAILNMTVGSRVRNDHEVDQNLATDFFADFPTELPTMATMVTMLAVLGYGYILTDDQ